MKIQRTLALVLLGFVLASTAQAAEVKRLYSGTRVARELITSGEAVIFAQEQQGHFQVMNFKTGAELAPIPSASDFPWKVVAATNGKLIGISLHGNRAAVIDAKTLKKTGELDLGGYRTEAGDFEPYWMFDGCVMPNGDLYFVSSTDVALVRVKAGATRATLVATQESAGLSGSTEVACAGGKLFVANHRSVLDPGDNQILVLSTQGKVIETIAAPGLLHLKASGNTLVIVSAPTQATAGSVQFGDASAEKLRVVAAERNDQYPQHIAFDAAGSRILVAEKAPAGFVEFDARTFAPIARTTFAAGDGISLPRGIAVSADGQTVLIESEGSVSAVTR